MSTITLIVLFIACYYCYKNSQDTSYQGWFGLPLLGIGFLLGLKVLGVFISLLYYVVIGIALFAIGTFILNYLKN